MYRFLNYLKFLFSATNQHGVHSPFVYNFVTKCLYQKTRRKLNVTEEVLLKSIDYFDFKNIFLINDSTTLKNQISTLGKEISFTETPFDLVYVAESSADFNEFLTYQIHNNSMILIKGIHTSKEDAKRWSQLQDMKRVSVTVDLFHCGIAFFRQEQVKEHFKIRI